jgi:four helix bundle protein
MHVPSNLNGSSEVASYRSLVAWQVAHELALEIGRVIRKFPPSERFELTSQLRRAALSVPTNLAEGRGTFGSRSFLRYVRIAASSLAEVDYLLLYSRDMGYLPAEPYDRLCQLRARTAFLVWRLAKGLQRPRKQPAS